MIVKWVRSVALSTNIIGTSKKNGSDYKTDFVKD